MNKRTAIVLASIAGALLIFIIAFERSTLSTGELSQRRGRVLSSFVRDHVTRVEIKRGSERPIVIERHGEGDELTWSLSAPVSAPVDEDSFESLMSALEWLNGERTLSGITDADRERFGLTHPRFEVAFTAADRQVRIRVGGEEPREHGVYVSGEDPTQAFVVGTDFVEAIDHDADHFRSKELFVGFHGSDARRVVLSHGDARIEIVRDGGVWQLHSPVTGWASRGALDGILRVPVSLRAARFVSGSDLSAFGLDHPVRELVIERPETGGLSGPRRARLRVGAACADHEGEVYVLAGDSGQVACTLSSELSALDIDAEHVRELRPISVPDEAVQRVVVEAGNRRMEVRRNDAAWQAVVGDGAPVDADPAAVAAWLAELRRLHAAGFDPVSGTPGHGLLSPRATLTISRNDDEPEQILRIGETDATTTFARRGDEGAIARFGPELAGLVTADALRFRARALLHEQPGNAASVRIARAGAPEERAERTPEGGWRLQAPISADADRVVVRDLVHQIASLGAERFVAAQAGPEHGLSTPQAEIEIAFAPAEGEPGEPSHHTLRVGSEVLDGAYARLDDAPEVFVIGRALLDAIAKPLVSLDLLAVPADDITALSIHRGAETIELHRQDGAWRSGTAEPDAERTRTLFDRLAALRASSVAYGAGAAVGAASLRITRREGDPTVIDIGPVQGQGDDAYALARRSDLAVTFHLPAADAQVLSHYRP